MRSRYLDWKLSGKVLIPLAAALGAIAITAAAYLYQQRIRLVEEEAEKMAQALALQIEQDRSYYTESVVGKLHTDLAKDGHTLKPGGAEFRQRQYGIPLPATFIREVTSAINRKGYYQADLLSLHPVNKVAGPAQRFRARSPGSTHAPEGQHAQHDCW